MRFDPGRRAAVLVLGGGRLLAAGAGAVGLIVLGRRVDPATLGTWAMALALQAYALHLAELGLRSAVTAIGATTRGGPRALVMPYLRLRLAVTAAVLVTVLGGAWLSAPDRWLLLALTLASLVPIALQLDWVALVEGRHVRATLPLVLRPTIFATLIACWPPPLTPLGIAAAFLLSWTAAATAAALLLGGARPAAGSAPVPSSTALLQQGRGFLAVTALNQVQLNADLLLVGLHLGAAAAGMYFVAAAIVTTATVFANGAGQLTLATARLAGHALLGRALLEAALLGIGLALAVALLGPPLLPLLLGPSFASAADLLPWLAPYLALSHLTAVLQPRLGAAGHQGDVIRAGLGSLAVLTVGLLAATLWASPEAFAVARGCAEAARVLLLWRAVQNRSARTTSTSDSQAIPPISSSSGTSRASSARAGSSAQIARTMASLPRSVSGSG